MLASTARLAHVIALWTCLAGWFASSFAPTTFVRSSAGFRRNPLGRVPSDFDGVFLGSGHQDASSDGDSLESPAFPVRPYGNAKLPVTSFRLQMSSSSTSGNERESIEYVKADDGEALQALFSKQCDTEGLMTKEELTAIAMIAEMLADGELLADELDDIWEAAPKFPIPDSTIQQQERIDVDSFIQIYRDIDDLFEDDDDAEEDVKTEANHTPIAPEVDSGVDTEDTSTPAEESEEEDDQTIARDEHELELAFGTICDSARLVSREALRQWDEIRQLLDDGMLGEDEFDDMWERTAKSPGSPDMLDVDGFLSFNVALDDLFVFDDDDVDEEADDEESVEAASDETIVAADASPVVEKEQSMVTGVDVPPEVIFDQLCDDDFLVAIEDLTRWGELQEMLSEGDLLPLELQNIYAGVSKARGTIDKLDKKGFLALYDAIQALFEYDDEEGKEQEATTATTETSGRTKQNLLALIAELDSIEDRLPCGLECTEAEELEVLKFADALEAEPSNRVVPLEGKNILSSDLTGTWDLLYTSSSSMKFNKGLSGLGGSFPNGKFGGLQQKLQWSKYMSDVEYTERIKVFPDALSFNVQVTGDWELRNSVSLFSGQPSVVMDIVPDKVNYGPTSTRGDHWKSLGSMNMLDVTYLDDDLRIMRGSTSKESIFILKRVFS